MSGGGGAAAAIARSNTTTSIAALPSMEDIRQGTILMAQQLNEFCHTHTFGKSPWNHLSTNNNNNNKNNTKNENPPSAPPIRNDHHRTILSDEELLSLQLSICRKIRELLPVNRTNVLSYAQSCQWIPKLLTFLNLHDRPAVQIEALLAIAAIAEVCVAATTAVQHPPDGTTTTNNNAMNSYHHLPHHPQFHPPHPGSVPFPPLSFSQTLAHEALEAFDASLSYSLMVSNHNSTSATTTTLANAAAAAANSAEAVAVINFTSLAPPPNGAHANITSNMFMPPPTPVVQKGHSTTFPQNLSACTQHLLLRHADAIPTLISLLNSTDVREVYEQAMWILGCIAAGDNAHHHHHPSNNNNNNSNAVAGSSSGTNANNNNGASSSSPNDKTSSGVVSARDVILAAGVWNPLLNCLEAHPENLSLQRIGSWTLSNLVDGIFQSSSVSTTANNNINNNAISAGVPPPTSSLTAPLLSSTAAAAAAAALNNNALHNTSSSSSTNVNTTAMNSFLSPLSAVSSTTIPLTDARMGSITTATANGVGTHKKSTSTKNNNISNTNEYSSADEIDMKVLLPVLHRLLHMTDSEVLSYVCWTLSHLCDGPASHIAAVVITPLHLQHLHPPGGLVPRLVELLVHPSWRVTKPALRTIGNIVCAECSDDANLNNNGNLNNNITNTDYTEVILECGAVPRLKELITHSNREIQKEACWTLSNIAAGTIDQIQAVIDSGAIPPLVNLVRDKKTDQEVRSEACWVVLNATSCGSDSQIEVLVDEGCVSVLGVLLAEASMVMMALEGLERVLQVEETREMIRRDHIENGEIEDVEENRTPILVSAELIEKARDSHNNSSSSAVTKRADRIWKQHFVSCALCKNSFSKHRISDASFCEECKCHVCSNCNCKIYHLDYQEELWAATEEKTEAKKNAKKTKNKKKKAKLKEKKAKQQHDDVVLSETTKEASLTKPLQQSSTTATSSDNNTKDIDTTNDKQASGSGSTSKMDLSLQADDEEEDDTQNQVDLVLYLQQTGSIIALSKLMDALEYGGDDFDEELDDYERKMIREQQLMRGGAQTTN
jgi:hypothetical protein